MLVRTKRGTLFNAPGGSDGPNVRLKPRATSKEMYVVRTKMAKIRKRKSCGISFYQG
jgi:hypothetical protein